jgi:hypothetical protein
MQAGCRFVLFAGLAAALAGCGGDEAAAPAVGEVAGLWHATEYAFESVPPGTTVDVVAIGGSASLDLQQDGDFVLVVAVPGELETTTYGIWEMSRDLMSLTPQGMPFSWQFDLALNANVLSLRGASVEYDFDFDDVPEAATLDMSLVK